MAQITGRRFDSNEPVQIEWCDGRIASIAPVAQALDHAAEDVFLCPGLVDLQVNGFAGKNFGEPQLTIDDIAMVTRRLWQTGCTHFLATLITDDVARMGAALKGLCRAAEQQELAGSILGFHLEGPYISEVDGPRGAHPRVHCKDPDWAEFCRLQDSAGGRIRLVTLAPERTGALPFIEKATRQGIRIALGHTAADRQQILDAVSAGASLATHLGNAAHDQIQRHHNYIFDQLAEDRLWASIIADGHHLPPQLVKIFWRTKGPDRTILISDLVHFGGMPPGVYDAGHCRVEVRSDGFIGVVDQPRLAGAGTPLLRGVENLVRFTGASFAQAVRAATVNPAGFLGIPDRLGQLDAGHEASFIVVRWTATNQRADVLQTIVAGKPVP
jgi:N-acetylglucosamine-6-phosphate deacetylase